MIRLSWVWVICMETSLWVGNRGLHFDFGVDWSSLAGLTLVRMLAS